jgi:hypothetical protein
MTTSTLARSSSMAARTLSSAADAGLLHELGEGALAEHEVREREMRRPDQTAKQQRQALHPVGDDHRATRERQLERHRA